MFHKCLHRGTAHLSTGCWRVIEAMSCRLSRSSPHTTLRSPLILAAALVNTLQHHSWACESKG